MSDTNKAIDSLKKVGANKQATDQALAQNLTVTCDSTKADGYDSDDDDSDCKNATATVSTYIEYEKAYKYALSDNSTSFFLYATVECSNENIALYGPFAGKSIERKDLGIAAVILDVFIMASFLFGLWSISYFVKVDSERHRKLLFETQEFAVQVDNLPTLNDVFAFEQMKAELWEHIQTVVKEQN